MHKSLSAPVSHPAKCSTTSTLDALDTLLSYDAISPGRLTYLSKDDGTTTLHLSPSIFSTPDVSLRNLDVSSHILGTHDSFRAPSRKAAPLTFPVILTSDKADPKLKRFLWPSSDSLPTSCQLREPEAKLQTNATRTRQLLAHRLTTASLVFIQRDLLKALIPITKSLDGTSLV